MLVSAILGAIQGVTEFLPVSSSGHLILVSWIMNGKPLPLALNTALHFGTLIAVLIYFWRDWKNLLFGSISSIKNKEKNSPQTQLLLALIVGSIPAGVIGLSAKNSIESIFHNPISTAFPLIIVGFLLWFVDQKYNKAKTIQNINLIDAFYIGIAQACALIPGVSRSGATITCSRFLLYDKESAAKFSFLLGTPAMAGAALLHYKDFLSSLNDPSFYVGILTSCVIGCLTIKFFLKFISNHGFLSFAIYRAILGILIIYNYFS